MRRRAEEIAELPLHRAPGVDRMPAGGIEQTRARPQRKLSGERDVASPDQPVGVAQRGTVLDLAHVAARRDLVERMRCVDLGRTTRGKHLHALLGADCDAT